MMRLAFGCIPLFMALLPSLAAAQDAAFAKVVAPFLEKHCIACHGPKKQESSVRFDKLTGMDVGSRNLWTMVHEQVAAGTMPPATRAQPDEAAKKGLLGWIRERQRALGPGGTRRLNRRELSAALRDITGLGVDFSLGLPGDGTVGGFDTGAEGLLEASDAVAQWLEVTRRAVEGIRFLEPARDKAFTANLQELMPVKKGPDPWKKVFEDWKPDGAIVKVPGQIAVGRFGSGLILRPQAVGDRDTVNFTIPTRPDRAGVVRLTVVVSALKPMAGLPNPRLWVKIGGKDIDYPEITAPYEKPQRLEYEAQLADLVVQAKGVNIQLSNKVEVPYAVKGFENDERGNPKDPPPGGTGLFRPVFDKKLPPEEQPAPSIVLRQVIIEPDVVMVWPPPHWKADVGTIKDDPASAKRLLALWMDRAWRRPVSEAELAPFFKLYERLRGERLTFDNALRAVFQSVLVSAAFRYQSSPGHADPAIAQYALASRLSFMLHGAPPDEELRRLAAAGKLKDSVVLDAQVDRLLDDPKSDAFIRPFVMQWLEMEQPITIAQDHVQKQDFRFARHLKASMREETIAYVAALVAENRPAKELVVNDWTMMNDALAHHYGYPPLEGGRLRKVKLRPDDPRGGGMLGHAGLQSMLCWMGENWVIYRGAWALRHILDQPPPPPPLEVPDLNPSEGKNKGKPFRELLKQHQEDTRCAVCHKTIDPIGFAFQNFDISGRWRDVEHESYARGELDGRVAWKGVGATRPVDALGTMPRGETFKSFAEFKHLLVKEYQADLVRGILKNLMVYGTGRLPGVDDRIEIAKILETHRPAGFPLRDLIKAVVRSRAFLEIRDPLPEFKLGRSSK